MTARAAATYQPTSPRRLSGARTWPVRAPYVGGWWYLTPAQFALTVFVRGRIAHRRTAFTLEQASLALGVDRSTALRGLRRLRMLGLIGVRSTRGRLGSHYVWPLSQAAAQREDRKRRAHGLVPTAETGNVAPSTPFGGFCTREGVLAGWRRFGSGRHPPSPSAEGGGGARRAGQLPRRLYAACPSDGARRLVTLTRWHVRRAAGMVSARWVGRCRRCDRLIDAEVTLEIPTAEGWITAHEAALRTEAIEKLRAWEAGRR